VEINMPNQKEPNSSIDSQIDKLFEGYEKDTKTDDAENVAESILSMFPLSLKRLNEADDGTTTPPKSGGDIDVSGFVNKILRLCDNFENLIEIKQVILRRAKSFLSEGGYDSDTLSLFDDSLREEHGIIVGETEDEVISNEDERWTAAGAGATQGSS
jgi:hypothetical protein